MRLEPRSPGPSAVFCRRTASAMLPEVLQDWLRLVLVGLQSPGHRVWCVILPLHQRLSCDIIKTLRNQGETKSNKLYTPKTGQLFVTRTQLCGVKFLKHQCPPLCSALLCPGKPFDTVNLLFKLSHFSAHTRTNTEVNIQPEMSYSFWAL